MQLGRLELGSEPRTILTPELMLFPLPYIPVYTLGAGSKGPRPRTECGGEIGGGAGGRGGVGGAQEQG